MPSRERDDFPNRVECVCGAFAESPREATEAGWSSTVVETVVEDYPLKVRKKDNKVLKRGPMVFRHIESRCPACIGGLLGDVT